MYFVTIFLCVFLPHHLHNGTNSLCVCVVCANIDFSTFGFSGTAYILQFAKTLTSTIFYLLFQLLFSRTLVLHSFYSTEMANLIHKICLNVYFYDSCRRIELNLFDSNFKSIRTASENTKQIPYRQNVNWFVMITIFRIPRKCVRLWKYFLIWWKVILSEASINLPGNCINYMK